MNKNFKRVAGLACGVAASLGVFALSACGGNGGSLYDGYGSNYIVSHEDGKTVTYTFEAEYTNVDNKAGTAFSGKRDNVNMIVEGDSSASNGYCIAGLCKKGLSINFVIVCDRDVDDATLILRVGNEEVPDVWSTITPESFLIRVDPVSEEDVQPYEDIGAWGKWDQFFLGYYYDSRTPIAKNEDATAAFQGYYIDEWDCGEIEYAATTSAPSGFDDWTVTTTLKLTKGLNCISLIVNNDDIPTGFGSNLATVYATAPAVDCIKIKTDAQLGMYNPVQNRSDLDLNKACTFK